MKLDAHDLADLRPLIDVVIASTVERLQANDAKLGHRLAFPEPEAAGLMGIPSHVLRDARLRGEIAGSRVGKKTLYSRESLLRFLSDRRIEQ